MNDFVKWFQGELNKRNWTLREASKQLGVSHSHINRIAKGYRPSADIIIKISTELNVNPVEVLKLAQLIPQDVTSDSEPDLYEINNIYRNLDDESKKIALEYIRFLQSRQD